MVSLLREENALDVCVIRVPDELKYTDYFIIVSGSSTRHLRAMAQYAIKVVNTCTHSYPYLRAMAPRSLVCSYMMTVCFISISV